jgi:hypothetical protein
MVKEKERNLLEEFDMCYELSLKMFKKYHIYE